MEKLMMIRDEMHDLRVLVPRMVAGIAGVALIVLAAFLNRL